jgi:hypothetical protein
MLLYRSLFYKEENMVPNEIEKSLALVFLGSIATFLIVTPIFPTIYAKEQTKIASNNNNNISTIINRSTPLIQKYTIGTNSYRNDINNNYTNEDILHRGLISSEAGQQTANGKQTCRSTIGSQT